MRACALTIAATIAAIAITMNSPHPSSEEIFHHLLDESSSLLTAPESAGIAIPDDDLHREIIVPLLPAMLADAAIRGHWNEQHATGFVARISRHFENGEAAPRWTPGDFEIHVTASYSAGPDARALADTLLSEESLRDMTAALMNQLLDALWLSVAPARSAAPSKVVTEITAPVSEEVPSASGPVICVETRPVPEGTPEVQPAESQVIHGALSRAIIGALCRKLPASAVQRGLLASGAGGLSAAILARRMLRRAGSETQRVRLISPPPLLRRASL